MDNRSSSPTVCLACAAFFLVSASAHAQDFDISPVVKFHDDQDLGAVFENDIYDDDPNRALVGFTGAIGDFSLEFLSGLRLSEVGLTQEDVDTVVSARPDNTTLNLTARYRPLSFLQVFGGFKRNRNGLDDVTAPAISGIEGLTLTIPERRFTNIRHDFFSQFAGMVVTLPVAGGNVSLGGAVSRAEGTESGQRPVTIDVSSGTLSLGRSPYREDLEVFSYQLHAGWSDEVRLPISAYPRLSYGVDVNYSVRDQRFERTGERDAAFSGTTVHGRARATFHF